ncbi:hypothetical protein VMCG_05191 [Cytospora schulzeri]|uniref:histidine--tRNA ligase n=1 Tax=Cytospora schulzeri TaxID=448051 RepID=A0A423WR80_9PEZI|nr:hypothetical protein VMCG_05191 [Valsa malicola]
MATPQETDLPSRAGPIQLKTPKGTLDWFGPDAQLRKHIFQTLSRVFEAHGGQELDTPVFELRDILSGKYGEDSKLIYDLEDQGGELCSLRYDLTVPFARWLAMNSNVAHVSRYHIAKVYRRDQPSIARGRYREFYQCDFDIAGEYEPMIPDAEILLIIAEAFEALHIDITIKLNHRRILDGIFAVAGVSDKMIRPISSAVDKLDKMPWDEVKKEMVEQKGLTEDVADQIGTFVRNSGDMHKLLNFLDSNPRLMENDDIKSGVDDITLLLSYLEAYNVTDKVLFDLSLARGLDYYTGLIFEVVTVIPDSKGGSTGKSQEVQVGSIAAGGRYDNLVGMYGKRNIPCVGISFGVDRIYTILDARRPKKKGGSHPGPDIDVYIMSVGDKGEGLLLERMAVLGQLTKAGVRTAFMRKANPKLLPQLKVARKVPINVILDPDELAAGNVRLKVSSGQEGDVEGKGDDRGEKNLGKLVSKVDLVAEVKRLLQ